MSSKRPNLFSFATSELSQDAFLCWLLAWASPDLRDVDEALNGVARAFVHAMFEKASEPPPPPDAPVSVHKQLKAADVVAEVGAEHVLIIEDKTHTKNHSDQLDRYRETLGRHFAGRKLVCVYLKTGDQSSYRDVAAKSWAVFTRADLLRVLRQGGSIGHDVYTDFLAHLERVEAGVNRYRTAPPSEWGRKGGDRRDPAYRGLFSALQAAGVKGDWNYVPNANGGFFAFWWGWHGVEGRDLYLQLEEGELVVKLGVPENDRRRELRDVWSHRVVGGLDDFRRPRRLGNGRWMTVATYDGDYRVVGADGFLDLDATVALLGRVATAVAEVAVG